MAVTGDNHIVGGVAEGYGVIDYNNKITVTASANSSGADRVGTVTLALDSDPSKKAVLTLTTSKAVGE